MLLCTTSSSIYLYIEDIIQYIHSGYRLSSIDLLISFC